LEAGSRLFGAQFLRRRIRGNHFCIAVVKETAKIVAGERAGSVIQQTASPLLRIAACLKEALKARDTSNFVDFF
jgi:hypothetical protein